MLQVFRLNFEGFPRFWEPALIQIGWADRVVQYLALQLREWREQVENLRAFFYQRQAHRFEGAQQALGGWLCSGARWLSGIQAGQCAVVLRQISPHLIFNHSQYTRGQSEQARQAKGMVIAAHPERSQRQSPSFQAGAISFDQPFIAIGEDGLPQG